MYGSKVTSYSDYLSGREVATTVEKVVELSNSVFQLLVYTTEPCYIKLNDNENEIFLFGNMWMPLSLSTKKFTIRTVAGETEVHWQGWFI